MNTSQVNLLYEISWCSLALYLSEKAQDIHAILSSVYNYASFRLAKSNTYIDWLQQQRKNEL